MSNMPSMLSSLIEISYLKYLIIKIYVVVIIVKK